MITPILKDSEKSGHPPPLIALGLGSISPEVLGVIGLNLHKGARRKVQILDSTIACLASLGVEHITFEEIGRRIGIRKSHVAYHFPNMKDLIETAMRYVLVSIHSYVVERVKGQTDLKQALKEQTRCVIEWTQNHPNHARVYLLFCYQCSYNPKLREIHREFREVGIQRAIALLSALFLRKRIGAVRYYRAARRAQDLVYGAMLTAMTWESPENTDLLIESTLRGLFDLLEAELKVSIGDPR